ncbi:MAG: hypothetical protein H6765_01420 [Candidatus Peribacteria bacterium]|nr:MAG: hypothetical protein H6765_01420 [Candidatus Peribacteria bacterium]
MVIQVRKERFLLDQPSPSTPVQSTPLEAEDEVLPPETDEELVETVTESDEDLFEFPLPDNVMILGKLTQLIKANPGTTPIHV